MMDQRTDEWFAARLGKVTASRVADVIAKTKSGYSSSRDNYAIELALERITGQRAEPFASAAMQWGTDTEPEARVTYEMHTGQLVAEVGFIQHPSIEMAGASPDGMVGDGGLVEIKCPNSMTHLRTLASGKPDPRYIPQMQWQMACTGREWCDFVSYDPRFPADCQLFVSRVVRDANQITELETEVAKFLDEVANLVRKIRK